MAQGNCHRATGPQGIAQTCLLRTLWTRTLLIVFPVAHWFSSPQDTYVILHIVCVLCHLSGSGNDVPQRQDCHLSLCSPSEQLCLRVWESKWVLSWLSLSYRSLDRVPGEFWGSPRVLFTTLYVETLVYTFSQNLHNPICSEGEKWHWFCAYVG